MVSGTSAGHALPSGHRPTLAAAVPPGPTHASLIHFQEGLFVNKTELVEHIAKHAPLIVDTRNAFKNVKGDRTHIVKA